MAVSLLIFGFLIVEPQRKGQMTKRVKTVKGKVGNDAAEIRCPFCPAVAFDSNGPKDQPWAKRQPSCDHIEFVYFGNYFKNGGFMWLKPDHYEDSSLRALLKQYDDAWDGSDQEKTWVAMEDRLGPRGGMFKMVRTNENETSWRVYYGFGQTAREK